MVTVKQNWPGPRPGGAPELEKRALGFTMIACTGYMHRIKVRIE